MQRRTVFTTKQLWFELHFDMDDAVDRAHAQSDVAHKIL